jgi:hypothetical protein
MKSQLMKLVKANVHELCEQALNHQAAANQSAHHAAYTTVFAKGHQRSKVAVLIRLQWLAINNLLDLRK